MALTKGQNSYADTSEADLYFEDRLDVAAWNEATTPQKAQALVTATAILDGLIWTGAAVSESQPLAFPRYGSYFDPRIGSIINLGEEVPNRIVTATFELAYHLLNNDGILDDTGSVTDISIEGAVNLKEIKKPSKIPPIVKTFIKPLLSNSSLNFWWRAN